MESLRGYRQFMYNRECEQANVPTRNRDWGRMGSYVHGTWDVGPSHRLLVDPQTWRANVGHNDERDERERGREDGRATDDGAAVHARGVAGALYMLDVLDDSLAPRL